MTLVCDVEDDTVTLKEKAEGEGGGYGWQGLWHVQRGEPHLTAS